MSPERVLELLQAVASGEATAAHAYQQLSRLPVEEVGGGGSPGESGTARGAAEPYARVDHHRALRLGFPEVVFCQGKTAEQSVEICRALAARSGGFLATRAGDAALEALALAFPSAHADRVARTVWLEAPDATRYPQLPPVLILAAGTSDLPVAEEAAVTAHAFGHDVERVYDVGVAGLHRLLQHERRLQEGGVAIVVAGMEGALPSVVGGLTGMPVVAVPTSVGYGASFGGLAALLGMLNSCASGITVVNIDNGFGAACAATRILRLLASRS